MNDRLLTTKEAAEMLSVSQPTIRRWCNDGKIKAVRVFTRWRVPESAINEILGTTEIKVKKPGKPQKTPDMLILESLGFKPRI